MTILSVTSFYLSFSILHSVASFFSSAHTRAALQTRQRKDINNPEFPAGVPIIRFQGPPILAESYVKSILRSPTLCSPSLPDSSLSPPMCFFPPFLTTHFPLLISLSLSRSPHTFQQSSLFLLPLTHSSSLTLLRTSAVRANKERMTPSPANVRGIFMAGICHTPIAKNTYHGVKRGEKKTHTG